MARAWNIQSRKDVAAVPDNEVPAGVGHDRWPGPASGKSGHVGAPVPTHPENFLRWVRTREKVTADAEVTHRTCGLINRGEIAFRTGTAVDFDPEQEMIRNSEAAGLMLSKGYRRPYGIPQSE